MVKVIPFGLWQLRSFRVDPRDKDEVRDLLYKLKIQLFGWNLRELCEEHFFAITPKARPDCHRNGLCRLLAILVSADAEHLLDHSDASFDVNDIDKERFLRFATEFVESLKASLIDSSAQSTKSDLLAHPRGIFDIMEGALYNYILPRNPAVPVITAFMLVLLADVYSFSIHNTTGTTVANSLWARVLLKAF